MVFEKDFCFVFVCGEVLMIDCTDDFPESILFVGIIEMVFS